MSRPTSSPPTYRQDPLYWESFWDNFLRSFKSRPKFKIFKFGWFEIVLFGGIAAFNGLLFIISSPVAWNTHRNTVLLLIFLSTALWEILIRRAWAIIPLLWKTYRKDRFRGEFKILVFGTLAVTIWALYCWHYCYVRNSHFNLAVVGVWGISNIPDYDQEGIRSKYPVASVLFTHLDLSNRYAPAKPHDWKLIATFPTGEEEEGFPPPSNRGSITSEPGLPFYDFKQGEFIWGRISEEFDRVGGIGNGNMITAPAEFIFPGIRTETLLTPVVILTIEVKGLNDTAQVTAPSHLRELHYQPGVN